MNTYEGLLSLKSLCFILKLVDCVDFENMIFSQHVFGKQFVVQRSNFQIQCQSLHEKCLYSKFFSSVFSLNAKKYGPENPEFAVNSLSFFSLFLSLPFLILNVQRLRLQKSSRIIANYWQNKTSYTKLLKAVAFRNLFHRQCC